LANARLAMTDRSAALRCVLDRAGSGTAAAAVIHGEAGVGKTALLDALAAVATRDGWRCLAVRGVEPESVLAFAGLLAIAQPLRVFVADLPPAQAAALDAALGRLRRGPGTRAGRAG
jgi:MoxR-like ATPase